MDGGGSGVARSVLAFGGNGVVAAGGSTSIRYSNSAGDAITGALPTAGLPGAAIVAPFAGTLRNLRVRLSAAAGAGITTRHTVYLNEVATAVLADIANPAQDADSGDLEVAVAAGDRIAIGMTRVAGVPGALAYAHTLELVSVA
jgi:hypothetical protein